MIILPRNQLGKKWYISKLNIKCYSFKATFEYAARQNKLSNLQRQWCKMKDETPFRLGSPKSCQHQLERGQSLSVWQRGNRYYLRAHIQNNIGMTLTARDRWHRQTHNVCHLCFDICVTCLCYHREVTQAGDTWAQRTTDRWDWCHQQMVNIINGQLTQLSTDMLYKHQQTVDTKRNRQVTQTPTDGWHGNSQVTRRQSGINL